MKNPFEMIFSKLQGAIQKRIQNPVPRDFRRGARRVNFLGYAPDKNSAHIGKYGDKITPMKRRMRGVSRTAKS